MYSTKYSPSLDSSEVQPAFWLFTWREHWSQTSNSIINYVHNWCLSSSHPTITEHLWVDDKHVVSEWKVFDTKYILSRTGAFTATLYMKRIQTVWKMILHVSLINLFIINVLYLETSPIKSENNVPFPFCLHLCFSLSANRIQCNYVFCSFSWMSKQKRWLLLDVPV